MGGFRRIYPKGPDKYTHFFENSCSLFQTTTAAKAREEAARYLLFVLKFLEEETACVSYRFCCFFV